MACGKDCPCQCIKPKRRRARQARAVKPQKPNPVVDLLSALVAQKVQQPINNPPFYKPLPVQTKSVATSTEPIKTTSTGTLTEQSIRQSMGMQTEPERAVARTQTEPERVSAEIQTEPERAVARTQIEPEAESFAKRAETILSSLEEKEPTKKPRSRSQESVVSEPRSVAASEVAKPTLVIAPNKQTLRKQLSEGARDIQRGFDLAAKIGGGQFKIVKPFQIKPMEQQLAEARAVRAGRAKFTGKMGNLLETLQEAADKETSAEGEQKVEFS